MCITFQMPLVFIEILKKNNLDCKQMQLCLNQEIINLKVT